MKGGDGFFRETMDAIAHFLMVRGYAVLFGWVLLEQLGLPIPSALLFLAAGTLVHAGNLNLVFVIGVVVTASCSAIKEHHKIPRNRDIVLCCY